jgi:hypothetical protein
MPLIARVLLSLSLCLSAACAPVFANRVLCTTESGHRAIEIPHEVCPETAGKDVDHGHVDPKPCEDQAVRPDSSISSHAKATVFKVDLTKTVYWLAAFQNALAGSQSVLASRSIPPDNDSPLPADQQRLSSIILLN